MTAGHKSFTLAADNEEDLQDWLVRLQSVLHQNKVQEDTRSASLEREKSKFFFENFEEKLKNNYLHLQHRASAQALRCLEH